MAEAVNHPSHYGGDTPYETIKVLAAWMGSEGVEAFCRGNTIKYLSRAGKKGSSEEDLKKARWYLNYELGLRLSPAMKVQDQVSEALRLLEAADPQDKIHSDISDAKQRLKRFLEDKRLNHE